ncbi:MAG: YicC/YloC family endoribonuclease [Lachnospiraceae bacterium]|nr:YicC/YloC family endoribonuclease [Lachnospiraceae bacterium]
MVRSMTGFGRYEVVRNSRKLTIEMKSVNHKYLDVNIKLPRLLNMFETGMRGILKEYAVRGKIDIVVSYEDMSGTDEQLKFNKKIAQEYMRYFKVMEEELGLRNDITVSSLSRYPDVLTMEDVQINEAEIWELMEETMKGACEKLAEARIKEGENLKADLCQKLDGLLDTVEFVEKKSPQVLEDYRNKLEEKMHEILSDTQIDDARIASEVVIFADKMCVDEEVVRLKSHVLGMKEELLHGDKQGRKLDFLAQEMNREANTILSKANNLEVTNKGIELKTEIEKIREQIQNIE